MVTLHYDKRPVWFYTACCPGSPLTAQLVLMELVACTSCSAGVGMLFTIWVLAD